MSDSQHQTDEPENRSCLGQIIASSMVVLSLTYLANFTMGIAEIPDTLPVVGNLDEVFFSGLLFSSLSYLGLHLPFAGQVRKKTKIKVQKEEPEDD